MSALGGKLTLAAAIVQDGTGAILRHPREGLVRKKLWLISSVFALGATPVLSQAWIGGVVGNLMDRGNMKWCYDGTARQNAKYFMGQIPYAEQAMGKYLRLARIGSSLDKMFTGTREHRLMFIDGVQADPRTAHDPWAAQIAKLDPLGYVLSNDSQNIHGHWRAIGSDGTTLGTYDVLMRAGVGGYHIRQVRLLPAGSSTQPDELKPFCIDPGDVEQWQEVKAKREAEQATQPSR